MTTQQPFNPSEHLINLRRKQRQPNGSYAEVDNPYLETRWRLVWLHDRYPDGASIVTELVEHKPGEYAVFKAQVAVDGKTATGWAIKHAGGPISYVENAETHAIGRALAALGLGTQWCDDFDEGRDDEGQVTPVDAPNRPKPASSPPATSAGSTPTPVRKPSPEPSRSSSASTSGQAPAGGWQDQGATEPQIRALYTISSKVKGWKEDEFESWCSDKYGKRPSELSRRQASELIDTLKQGA